jgi:hypothetical protein
VLATWDIRSEKGTLRGMCWLLGTSVRKLRLDCKHHEKGKSKSRKPEMAHCDSHERLAGEWKFPDRF